MLLIGLIYFVLSVAAIIILSVRLRKCMKKNESEPIEPVEPVEPVKPDDSDVAENFCGSCQGIGSMTFRNPTEMSRLYEEGKLTEFTPMPESTEWKKTCMM